ncbi:MAG: thioredoxin family protein [Gallionella sp.]
MNDQVNSDSGLKPKAKLSKRAWSIFAAVLALFAAVYFMLPKPLAETYTQAKLDALNQSGQPVLVAIHADWCSTCKTQERVLQELLPKAEFKRITMLRMDFDQQKEAVRSFGVEYQSTLIVFKDGREVGRSTAQQNTVRIADLLRLSL